MYPRICHLLLRCRSTPKRALPALVFALSPSPGPYRRSRIAGQGPTASPRSSFRPPSPCPCPAAAAHRRLHHRLVALLHNEPCTSCPGFLALPPRWRRGRARGGGRGEEAGRGEEEGEGRRARGGGRGEAPGRPASRLLAGRPPAPAPPGFSPPPPRPPASAGLKPELGPSPGRPRAQIEIAGTRFASPSTASSQS
jgi:hypothetical protein